MKICDFEKNLLIAGISGHGHSGHGLRQNAETKQQKRPLSIAKPESAAWTPQRFQEGKRPYHVDQQYMIQLGTLTRPSPSPASRGNQQWNKQR